MFERKKPTTAAEPENSVLVTDPREQAASADDLPLLGPTPSGAAVASVAGNTKSRNIRGLLETLDKDMAAGTLDIPGFPDVALRLHEALRKEDTPTREIVALINSEPGLVSRLLRISNTAAFNTSGIIIADLQTAVARLGYKVVLSAAHSYALQQMEQQESLQPIRPWLAEIWLTSNAVAAICYVVAKHVGHLSNEAMVAGLLHRIGDLYLLVQAVKRDVDIQDDTEWDAIVVKWHATIGGEILNQWKLPDYIADAVAMQDALGLPDADELKPFAALLAAAKLYNGVRDQQAGKQAAEAAALLEPIEVWGCSFLQLVAEHHDEIESVRTAIA